MQNGALRAGSFARATIVTDTTATSLAIPSEALVTFAGIEKAKLELTDALIKSVQNNQ